MSEWYLRKNDGEIYGPVALDELKQWAADGRIAPEDNLSVDREQWNPAMDAADLDMDWMVLVPEKDAFGPLHVLAMADLITEGVVDASTTIRHRKTGQECPLGDALIQALIQRGSALKESVARLQHHPVAEQPEGSQRDASVSETDAASGEQAKQADSHAEIRQYAIENDQLQRELRKWQAMYKDEREGGRQIENKLTDRINELRRNNTETLTKLEDAERRLRHLDSNYKMLMKASESDTSEGDLRSQLALLITTHNELSQSYDTLMTQLQQKSQQLEEMIEQRAQIEAQADERIRLMETTMKREQDEATRARTQFALIEETHLQLVTSYRDMNDRFIRYRQQLLAKETTTAGATTTTEEAAEETGPKVRLHR